MKFVNYKIEGKYKDCISMLLNQRIKLLNIKNIVLFFLPSLLLKKYYGFN